MYTQKIPGYNIRPNRTDIQRSLERGKTNSFWSDELDHISDLRKKLKASFSGRNFQKTMSQNLEDGWERYLKCKSGIRNDVNRRKRAEYQCYIREIE